MIAVIEAHFAVEPSLTPPLPAEARTLQAFSAFALTYILRLRSCRLIGAFIIRLCLSMLPKDLQNSRAPSLHRCYLFHRYHGPVLGPLTFDRFPGVSGYTVYLATVDFSSG